MDGCRNYLQDTPLPKQFLVPRKKPKKRSIPHVPGSSVDSENISRENIFATLTHLAFVELLLYRICYFVDIWNCIIKYLLLFYILFGSKFDSEQKSIHVNFHENA